MPWNESTRMDERRRFVEAYLSGQFSMTELCRSAGVSRPTGYLWVERYRRLGEVGLTDRSHAPHHCPHRTPEEVAKQLLALRFEFAQLLGFDNYAQWVTADKMVGSPQRVEKAQPGGSSRGEGTVPAMASRRPRRPRRGSARSSARV